jgi:hypothetical protein
LRRLALVVPLAALSLMASASPAPASVTIGQLASPPSGTCTAGFDWVQRSVTSGNTYVVPALPPASALVITSWSHNANATAGQVLTMKVYRRVAGLVYMVVGHDGPRTLNGGALNTFPVTVPVKPGDLLGLHTGTGPTSCIIGNPGEPLFRNGDLADGASGTFAAEFGRLNITAVVAPSNAFTLGDLDRNRKKGTAKLTVNVPNPGELDLSGKGLKKRDKSPGAAGDVVLKIKAKKNKLDRLNENGKVKLKPKITFTPTGGDPSTQSRKLRLRKR